MPVQPFPTTQNDFPFTLQGNFTSFGMDKDQEYDLKFDGVINRLQKYYGNLASGAQMAVQIHSIGVYGNTSSLNPASAGGVSQQSPVTLQDAYTGRIVTGYGTPFVRARAGFHLALVEAMKWYNATNLDAISEHHLAYVRVGEGFALPPDDWASGFDMVVKGVARYTRKPTQ